MNQCSKKVIVTIDSKNGPSWSSMNWDVKNFSGGSVANGSASGTTVTGNLVAKVSPQSSAIANIHGSLSYTGPACNCKITLTAAYDIVGLGNLQISVLQDGVEVKRIGPGADSEPATGVYPFSLLAGNASLIEITGSGFLLPVPGMAIAYAFSPDAGSVNWSFTVSNV